MNFLSNTLYIHGFLGEHDEFSPMQGIDLYSLSKLNNDQIFFQLDKYSHYKNVVAYSLGGRFLLHYYKQFFSNFENIYLVSTHFGLNSKLERVQRLKFTNLVIDKLNSLTKDQFLIFWNNLNIFNNCEKRVNLKRPISEYVQLFERWPLENQLFFQHEVFSNSKFKVILGEHDTKYLKLYENKKNKKIIKDVGHRINIIKHQEEIFE